MYQIPNTQNQNCEKQRPGFMMFTGANNMENNTILTNGEYVGFNWTNAGTNVKLGSVPVIGKSIATCPVLASQFETPSQTLGGLVRRVFRLWDHSCRLARSIYHRRF